MIVARLQARFADHRLGSVSLKVSQAVAGACHLAAVRKPWPAAVAVDSIVVRQGGAQRLGTRPQFLHEYG
jgi:hypothetical protein